MTARNSASALRTWQTDGSLPRRRPLSRSVLGGARLLLVAAALGYLGLSLLSSLRSQSDLVTDTLLVGTAQAEMATR